MNYLDTGEYFILLALAEGSGHGAGLRAQMIGDSVGAIYLQSSSLYDALIKLETAKLIERTSGLEAKAHRKSYRLTDNGQRQFAFATHTYERAVDLAKRRLGWRY